MIDAFCKWLLRKTLHFATPIDYGLKKGDRVRNPYSDFFCNLEIVDINWALLAAAVRLNADDDESGIVVWPVWRLERVE